MHVVAAWAGKDTSILQPDSPLGGWALRLKWVTRQWVSAESSLSLSIIQMLAGQFSVEHSLEGLLFSVSHVQLLATPWTAISQASLSFTISQSCSNSCPLSQWCHPTISSSVALFSYPQSFSVLGSLPMSQLFPSGGQSIRDSASASVLPMNIQGWFPSGLTGLISLKSKGLSRVFSSTTVRKHQFYGLLYGPPLTFIHDYWRNHICNYMDLCWQCNVSAF